MGSANNVYLMYCNVFIVSYSWCYSLELLEAVSKSQLFSYLNTTVDSLLIYLIFKNCQGNKTDFMPNPKDRTRRINDSRTCAQNAHSHSTRANT